MLLDALNSEQRKAAEIITGPVMVFAGAGSGKTRTLTYRIANMIDNGINPQHILAITFTNKATNEMKERLINLVGPQALLLTISTFHSLCARILRKEISILGYSNNFAIIDDEEQLKIINEVLEEGNYNKKQFSSKYIRNRINQYKTFKVKSKINVENIIVDEYEKLMFKYNLLDFSDLLLKVYEIFSKYPEVLKKYQDKYQYILVDEFQDTDSYQYEIIKMLSLKHHNLFVVGDDDQSIYGFRGADYRNIKKFKKDFPELQKILLEENYRSTQTILNGSNRLISHNNDREKKTLFSKTPGSDSDVSLYQASDHQAEVEYVVNRINGFLKEGYSTKDIAILYRSSFVLRNFELGMIQANLGYRVFGGVSYLRRKEIKDMIAYLRLIVFNDDIPSFKRIINEPSRLLGEKTIKTLLAYCEENHLPIFSGIDDSWHFLKSKAKELQDFKEMILELRNMLDEKDLVAVYEELLEKTKYLQSLENDDDYEERKQNLMEFKSILYKVEREGEGLSRVEKLISAFDDAILSDDKLQNQRQSQDGITLSTIHSVKGLEFKIVFIVAFEEGIFPSLRRDEDVDLEEERRIAYVAVTRAKEKLIFTCANKRLLYGTYQSNQRSPFLVEFFAKEEEPKEENIYKVGQMIHHQVYGDGIIVSLNGTIGQVCFTKQGVIKSFDMMHPSISKKK